MSPAIPDRWIPYSALGNVIEGTRIVCFKVPLKKEVQKFIYEKNIIKEIWDTDAVINSIPNLGLVIDITNTNKYYDPQDFREMGVQHVKIFTRGHVIPPKHTVKTFSDIIEDFLNSTQDKLVGVHCTHGLNRTGYLVCKYMVERMGLNPEIAIERFEKARGHKMERENYLADIKRPIGFNQSHQGRHDRKREEPLSWRTRP